jgi:orotidine-5'-phosphate decarboxylase
VTVHPYLGLAAMGAFVSRAHQAGSCMLVVTRSSNPEGRAVQSALGKGGRQVDEGLLGEIGKLNRMLAGREIGPVGAVVGPARIEPELDLASAQALFLAPGVGAQGATPEDVARVFAACPDRVMPSASRSLLLAGPDIIALQDRGAAMAAEFRRLLPGRANATARTL